MPFFGQVWLWSLAGFLVGALLCWALIANPARRRIADLENRLAAVRRRGAEPVEQRPDADDFGAARYPAAALVPGFADDVRDEPRHELDRYERPRYDDDEPEDEAAQRGALQLFEPDLDERDDDRQAGSFDGGLFTRPGQPDEAVELAEATQYIPAARLAPDESVEAPAELDDDDRRDWFVGDGSDDRSADQHLVDDLDDDDGDPGDQTLYADTGGTIFTQHTTPIPAELISRIDAEGKAEAAAKADYALVDDLADESEADGAERNGTDPADHHHEHFAGAIPAIASVDAATQFVRPVQVDEPDDAEQDAEQAHQAHTRVLPTPPKPVWAEVGGRSGEFPEPASDEPERTQAVLPKRVPAKPQNRQPFGVETSPAAPARPLAAGEDAGDRERSLFEPVLPADEVTNSTPLPQLPQRPQGARTLQSPTGGLDPFVASGPFGPGSALPLPGGQSPSGEYKIKASVTALRYCSPESPKFDRTVAEVWFRTVGDAERVGFRPLG
ncbi:sunset domain-containing protein [Actinokineospora sp.]|uniref:sunset domain-containing protein n=1 Tax=Actinokineospora sp. TaxID=1872133 RepID=UPI004037FCAE